MNHPGAFIVGTGRVGSTLMSGIIRTHPQALSLSETFMSLASQAFAYRTLSGPGFWRLLSRPTAANKAIFTPQGLPGEYLFEPGPDSRFTQHDAPPILRTLLPHLSDQPEALFFELEPVLRARPRAAIGAHYRFFFDWLAQRQGKRLWIERTGGSLAYLSSMHRCFAGARFIHLVRDGRETAMSIVEHPGMRVFAHMHRRLKRVGIDILRPPFLLASNLPTALFDRYLGGLIPYERTLAEPLSPAQAGALWSATVLAGLENWARIAPEQRHEMRYEDLVARPRETLEGFARFIDPGLADPTWLDDAAKRPEQRPERWRALPRAERDALEAACAPGLEALGHA